MADNGNDDSNTQSDSRWKNSKSAGGLRAAGSSLSSLSQSEMDRASQRIEPVAYKRGGKVRRTGIAKLHKHERVIPAGKVKRVEKMMRKAKMRMKARS